MSCRVRGAAVALLLLSGALAPAGAIERHAASAAGRTASRAPVTQQSAVANLWKHLTRLWGATGASLDPFGNPVPGGQGTSGTNTDYPSSDTGASLDPFGIK
jgi:hypothetical protein